MSVDKAAAKQALGARIAALRHRAGLSKAELARRMGVEWGTVRRWERGEFLPPGGRLGELADALEATQAELVGTEAPPPDELSSLVGRIAREHPERVDMLLRILRSLAAP